MRKSKKIALVGLDGSGKSTNIEKMKRDADYKEYYFLWVRWKPFLLRPAYWLLNRKINNNKKKRKEMGSKSLSGNLKEQYRVKTGLKEKIFKNPLVRGGWMLFALIDYWFQFYMKAGRLLLCGKNIIFDRFYLDLFVDQGISFGYSPEKIADEVHKYQKLFPQMKKIVYLRADPQICFMRKDDIPSMDYLTKRFKVYEALSKNPEWVCVDGGRNFDEVYSSIKQIILEK